MPPKHRIANARRYVDISALKLDPEARTAALAKQGMWLDLGGLAKGLIGDEVIALFKRRGIPRCRYRAGGDMVFGDAPPNADGWRVVVPDLLVDEDGEGPQPLTFLASRRCSGAMKAGEPRVAPARVARSSSSVEKRAMPKSARRTSPLSSNRMF